MNQIEDRVSLESVILDLCVQRQRKAGNVKMLTEQIQRLIEVSQHESK